MKKNEKITKKMDDLELMMKIHSENMAFVAKMKAMEYTISCIEKAMKENETNAGK